MPMTVKKKAGKANAFKKRPAALTASEPQQLPADDAKPAASIEVATSTGGSQQTGGTHHVYLQSLQALLVRTFAGHGLVARCGVLMPFPIRAACVFPGGSRVITSGEDGTSRIWDAVSGELLLVLKCHRAGALGTAVFPDGCRVLTTGADGDAVVWDVNRGTPLSRLEGHNTPVTGGAVFPDGERVITMGLDGSGRIWDVRSQRILAPLAGVGKTVVAIFPDGEHVAVASEKGRAEIWHGRTGQLTAEVDGHRGAVTAMALFPGGGRLLTTGEDGAAFVFDAKSGQKLTELPRHRDAILCGAVSPCGTRLLTGGRDGIARLSDATTGETVATWAADGGQAPCADSGPAAERPIYSCAFFPSGSHVLLAGAAGGRIWQLPEMGSLENSMQTGNVQ